MDVNVKKKWPCLDDNNGNIISAKICVVICGNQNRGSRAQIEDTSQSRCTKVPQIIFEHTQKTDVVSHMYSKNMANSFIMISILLMIIVKKHYLMNSEQSSRKREKSQQNKNS